MDTNTIKCFKCDVEMKNWEYFTPQEEFIEVHPIDSGLSFRTYGHYGSTIFDPVGTGEYLDVAICDYCVMKNLEKVRGNGKESLKNNVDIIVDAMERHG